MKKTLFSLEEIMPSNIYKNTKESSVVKNREKENTKVKSVAKLKKANKSNKKNLHQNNKQIDYSKTPVKIVGKVKINKYINNFNECNKNSNNNVLSFSTNGKQMLLLEYFLQNNNKNVKTNIFLIGSKKDDLKNLNKVTKSLLPMKRKIYNSKLQNTRYFNNNSKNNKNNINKNKEKSDIKKNGNKIINKKGSIKEMMNKKEEDTKNNNIINKNNTITNNNILHKTSFNSKMKIKDEKDFNLLRTSVNLSNKKKELEKYNNENTKRDINVIKTPNNIFKNKILNILNNYNNSNDVIELNRSDNLLFLNQFPNRRYSSKKNSMKSNSLEKFLSHKFNLNDLSTKSLFSLTKIKKRNQSENSFLVSNNPKKNEGNPNIKKFRKNNKENKSCDTFFHKKNSVCVEKIGLKIIRNNKENNTHKSNNIQNKNNGNTKKNFFSTGKMMKRFKKHKSLDFNSKNSLNGLMISQNEIKDLLVKKDNKTPEKKPVVLNIHLENNNNKTINTNKKILNYTYNIIPGNNRKLIERCLLNRKNWIPSINEKNEFSNLIWTPLSSQINFAAHALVENAQFVNHFEYHNELTNKSKTFINLLRYCEFNDIDLFSFYPLTIIFTFNSNILNNQIEKFKKLYNEISSLVYDPKEMEKEDENDSSAKLYSDYFTVNLSKKLGSFQKIHIPKTHYAGKNLWLLKRDNLNRGRKIKVFSNLDDILKEINSLNEQKFPKNLLIQKYIEQPLLYNKRKFDIRIWVLFTYLDRVKKYEVFIFKEGHLKACCDDYDINSEDLFIHLTNYSVQKHNKNFSKSEIGNEISFADFQKELNKTGKNIDFKKNIFPEIMQIVAMSANSVKGKINLSKRINCFEIFGYDFILDINFKPFLLEINTNPGYEESSPLIKMLVPRMIDDAMKLTIDKEFETTYASNETNKSNFFVEGYSSEENMWLKIKTTL